jgi:glucans biosynthesis protein
LPEGRGTRVTFLMTPGEAETLELRLVLRDGTGAEASPVWLHRWTRARDGGV